MSDDNISALIIGTFIIMLFAIVFGLCSYNEKLHYEVLTKCIELTQKPLECHAGVR